MSDLNPDLKVQPEPVGETPRLDKEMAELTEQDAPHARLEELAMALASEHTNLYLSSRGTPLTRYLGTYQVIFQQAIRFFRSAQRQEISLSIAAEWMLDNEHIIRQAIRQVRKDLPLPFYHKLMKLPGPENSHVPRIFDLASALIQHDQAQLNPERMKHFIHTYQQTNPLKIGELWAFPSMLRLGILQSLALALLRITNFEEDMELPSLPLDLSEDLTGDEIVAHSISSLRKLGTEDWKDFFEELSLVENILDQDPAGIYPRMEFFTRDRYRKIIERIAAKSGRPEWEVSRLAIRQAQASPKDVHVGCYLLESGLEELETGLGYRPSGIERITRWLSSHPTLVYLSSISLVYGLLLSLLLLYAFLSGATVLSLLVLILLAMIPVSTFGIDLINNIITHLVKPRVLPKLDFDDGLPPNCSTIVVIPALVSNIKEVDFLLRQLEKHYLSNSGEHIYFGLITDFPDAPQKTMPGDVQLVRHAVWGIESLNKKYPREEYDPFFLLHRERRWNPVEGVWMGWERKRGKIHELNRLILGQHNGSFIVKVGALLVLPEIRYVITLDADSVLPKKAAHRLVATLAHPLNRAVFDSETQRVTSGYTILQPRTEILPARANQSLFTRIFAGDTGLDLYTTAVSNVYQDLFGEGIFVGKGIYEVASFERSLADRVPENALLSHDLFEGICGRTGLVTDVVIFEDYPPNYLVKVHREHRWIRGDWQLLPWLFPRVPTAKQRNRETNRLKFIDRWKILDNLRRSLLAPFLLLFILAGWIWLPGSAIIWTLLGVSVLSVPTLTAVLTAAIQLVQGENPGKTLVTIWDNLRRWLLAIAFLPFEAKVHQDAVETTLGRIFINRQRLLQWTTAAQASRDVGEKIKPGFTWRQMIVALLIPTILGLTVLFVASQRILAALPILLLWVSSPQIAYWISRPIRLKPEQLSPSETKNLRSLARLTWLFFEKFVGPEDHWLPPDHFQEYPRGVVAHRTSPTNIGLGFLSILAAYDFGYLELVDVVARLNLTFDALKQLERYRGHFLNWYDTRNLAPLRPAYISTVDSGNLAASLVALGQGYQSLASQPLFRRETWQGLEDTLGIIAEVLDSLKDTLDGEEAASLRAYIENFYQQLQTIEEQPGSWYRALTRLTQKGFAFTGEESEDFSLEELDRRLISLVEANATEIGVDNIRRLRIYTRHLGKHLAGAERQVDLLMPWLALLEDLPALFTEQSLDEEMLRICLDLQDRLPDTPSLSELVELPEYALIPLQKLRAKLEATDYEITRKAEAQDWLNQLEESIISAGKSARGLQEDLNEQYRLCEEYANQMDFSFLFDPQRKVFFIGYNLGIDRLDANHYDLLASEARLASLFAIAKGDVPQSHWLHLSRPVTRVNGTLALVSWSATMFEYLMPPLLLRTYDGTLLNQSVRAAVDYQIDYAKSKNVPWGFSESAFFHFDNNLNYQYRAFGVPDLGYKRGLANDLVVAPYASFLALPFHPEAVMENYRRLKELGMLGLYGLYESVDFTADRMPPGEDFVIVRSFMSHHQSMLFLSLVNYLKTNVMVERFHGDPRIQTVELLLQEQIPFNAPLEARSRIDSQITPPVAAKVKINPWRVRTNPTQPRPHLLSNGRYSVMITSAGGGFSRWRNYDLTRWRPDTTLDNWGTWVYIQDLDNPDRALWSAALQPTGRKPQRLDVTYDAGKAEFHRRDGDISSVMDIVIPPDEDVEIRRLVLTNHSDQTRRLRLTSYAEVILALQSGDERHPAYNKLFIESSYLPELSLLLFRRRPRSAIEDPIFLGHTVVMESGQLIDFAFESDRTKFIGRGFTPRRPRSLRHANHRLSGSTGATLDPIASCSCVLELPPHGRAQLAFLTLAGSSRQAIEALVNRYRLWHNIDWAFDEADSYAEMELRKLGLTGPKLNQIQRLLSMLVYPHRALRATPEVLAANRKGQSGLWGHSISGDHPILLASIKGSEGLPLIRELLRAHAYWRKALMKVDLVILNEEGTQYGQELNREIHRLIVSQKADRWLTRRGGIFVLNSDQISETDRILLQTAARAVLDADGTSLSNQLQKLSLEPSRLPPLVTTGIPSEDVISTSPVCRPENLGFDNGLGGTSPDGQEYLIYLSKRRNTPLPWINVIANETFGFMVSETGNSTTWAANSGENRLTPWSNDPVTEPPGEVVYLRDEETGEVWTPTPAPVRSSASYLVRHGAGYTIFEHNSHGLKQHLQFFIDPGDPVKIIQLRLENLLDRPRRITATYYVEWVLGVNRSETQLFVIPEYEAEPQALLARNSYQAEFADRVAFAAANKPLHGLTADRTEFLGRAGSYRRPAALGRIGLAGTVEAGVDPCAALQLHLDLPPGGSEEVYFLLGQADDRNHALQLVKRYQQGSEVARAWRDLGDHWNRLLGTLAVNTPDLALDFMLNRWLQYQNISCRIFGRSAFYQSSGAFGFRDQLQDVLAVLLAAPEITRAHILRAARHQFDEGDVLHWWHPPSGRGIRTRISDDLLWLPYATAEYVETTGDQSILSEPVPFLKGPPLDSDEEERYGFFTTGEVERPLLEHCHRALARGFKLGPQGLPLIGTGDWNDGFNRVGVEGRGESVWLAWFLNVTLDRFAAICEAIGESEYAGRYREQAAKLVQAIEEHAWDGQWYLRAFYDDGTPLGSAQNRECQIDSLAQSWAVLSGAGDSERAGRAMRSLAERLVRKEDRLILLLAPPFDKTVHDPGYIRGYLPGIRENGGQYTHAAIWATWAYTELGDGNEAGELFKLLNPIYHADTYRKAQLYKVEPYVIAADIYGTPPHVGRGGWTWYTGSGGWMYRLGVEAILGFRKRGETLRLDPCVPASWEGYQIHYRYGKSTYHIEVRNPDGVSRSIRQLSLDGVDLPDSTIHLEDDGQEHHVTAVLGT